MIRRHFSSATDLMKLLIKEGSSKEVLDKGITVLEELRDVQQVNVKMQQENLKMQQENLKMEATIKEMRNDLIPREELSRIVYLRGFQGMPF